MYSLYFETKAIDDLKRLSRNAQNFLKKEIPKKLTLDPAGTSSVLTGPLKGFHSCHISQYRIIFMIAELQVWIVGVGEHSRSPESDIYRRLEEAYKRGELAGNLLSTLSRFRRLLSEKK